jgi:hypothetical protein
MTSWSRTVEKLELSPPSSLFAYRGAKLWNAVGGVLLSSSKATAKMTIKRETNKFPN